MKILGAVRLAKKEQPDLKVLFLGTFFPSGIEVRKCLILLSKNNLEEQCDPDGCRSLQRSSRVIIEK